MPSLGRVFAIFIATACVVAVAAGCGSGGDSARNSDGGKNSLVAADAEVVEIPARWASGNANDIPTLVASTGIVFVGEVTSLTQRTQEIGAGLGADAGASPSAPKPAGDGAGRRASFPISVFQVKVVRSIAGGLTVGQSVALEQPGGLITRTDGSRARIVLEGDEPIQVGTRYLMFASVRADGTLASSPFGRFIVGNDGSIAPLGEWASLPVARQLDGASVEEAVSEVQAHAR